MNCIFCNNNKLYVLKTNQLKCSKCKKKFSKKKLKQKEQIIDCFCSNITINQSKVKLNLNYLTIKKHYDNFRKNISLYLENLYNQENISAYEEYIYIEKSKKHKEENIFEAKSFICFEYERKVFNLLMPSLSMYKEEYRNKGFSDISYKEFSNFLRFNKLSKKSKNQTLIQRFLYYFEDEILKYKGIREENFFYYLKEIEFKFNFTVEEQKKILRSFI